MALIYVIKNDEDQICIELYNDGDTYFKRHRKVDDETKFRISRIRGAFDKKYMPNLSRKQFIVP